jgi:hypothetical protein
MTMVFRDTVVRVLDSAVGPNTYVVEATQSDPRVGDAVVTIAIGNLRIRFVRERGQIFAEALSVRAPRHRDHLFHAIVITHSTAS